MIQLRSLTLFVIFSVIALISGQHRREDYCRLCRTHTMCLFPNPNPDPVCLVSHVGLNSDQKREILELHNNLRQKVASGGEIRGNPGPQPPAISIPDLIWDDELAIIAQRWVNTCPFHQDECRHVQRFLVGQNIGVLYVETVPSNIITRIINDWYKEVNKFDSRQVERVMDYSDVHRYTQLVWSTTRFIGCGYINHRFNNHVIITTLVCNYGPAGNNIGGKVYDIKRT
ncbi:venom allergen 3-like [Leptopilina heterotoma]|uniref:venom allergen 3-like n=1 Tax=Leptopilina heterotoma TaxID=63436 RepID=UPI001CAA0363|nr:venom allergen 3-like [Leptopilina heterotoma]